MVAPCLPAADNRQGDKHVESNFNHRVDEGSNPSRSTIIVPRTHYLVMTATITLITLLCYFALLLIVAHFTGGRGNNDDFFRASRRSPWYLVAFGMLGASVSGVSFVSVPGMVGKIDWTYLQMCIGFFFGYVVIAAVLLPVYYRLRLTSIYGYLSLRFGVCSHKTGSLFFLLSKLSGAAARFFLVCLVLQQFVFSALGLSFPLTILIMLLLTWLYTRRAGIRTLVYTDTLQTLCLLAALVTVIVMLCRNMGLDVQGLIQTIRESGHSRTFVFSDWHSTQNFWKQFLSGVFVTIVMTGLDQDMMQKNLTCRSLAEARKDMCCYGICFIPLNLLFLILGVLLYAYAAQVGLVVPEQTDNLFPAVVASGGLPPIVTILFVLGITSAAFSSIDSALTSLTTSVCIDMLQIEQRGLDERRALNTRRMVHIGVVAVFVAFVLIFKAVNSSSVIDAVYIMASYTYGPLLGLFAFGLFTRRMPRDRFVPAVCIASPLLCYMLYSVVLSSTGYRFGYELLLVNGLLTFVGLLAFSSKRTATELQ